MNKSELIDYVVKNSKENLSKKEVSNVLDIVFDGITHSLKTGDSFSMIGFGTFSTVKRSARMGRNPRTGEEIEIPEANVAKFKPGKVLKEAVNK